jgi:TolB protein
MNKKLLVAFLAASAIFISSALVLTGQNSDISGVITTSERPAIAVPDFRGSGDAQRVMDPFNQTLWDALSGSGALKMAAKSLYPLEVPQRPQDFRVPVSVPARRGASPPQSSSNGLWLTDWSGPPVNANYLAFGYTGVQDGRLVLFGWLYNLGQPGSRERSGHREAILWIAGCRWSRRKVANEFAADILQQFGAKSLAGSKILFRVGPDGLQGNLVDGLRRLQSSGN